MSNKLQQQGFVLVSVLLITSISTFFAFSAIAESRLQERIAGNQVKEVNARAQAEKGLLEVVKDIDAKDANGDTIAEIITALNDSTIDRDYQVSVSYGTSANMLKLASTGEYNDSDAYLNADLFFKSSNPKAGGAIIACEGINLLGSGKVDSFDSTKGIYSSGNSDSNASVVALNGDVNMSGNTTINGDLTVTGALNQSGSATFGGNVATTGIATLAQSTVAGNLSSNSDINLSGTIIGNASVADVGNISALGDLDIVYDGAKSSSLGDTATVSVNGEVTGSAGSLSTLSNNYTGENAASIAVTDDECNKVDIASAIPASAQTPNTNMNGLPNGELELTFNADESTVQVRADANTAEGDVLGENDTDPLEAIAPQMLSSPLWGDETKEVYVFDDFIIDKTMIEIVGDIIIMVEGDLIGGTGGVNGFKLGTPDSTLTILVKGQVKIDHSTKIFENAVVNADNPKVPMTIYSSYVSDSDGNPDINEDGISDVDSDGHLIEPDDTAVELKGDGNINAKVYAPLGNIHYSASGEMMGSLEGKNVRVSGSGDIHYDEAFGLINPTDPEAGKAKFVSVYYHYPN